MCQFVDDISTVTELIRQRKDMRVVEERDYITHNKPSGYRSYHMIVEYPVETIQGKSSISGNTNPYTGHEFLGFNRAFFKL